jgi:Fe-S-cluster containining protein
MNFPCTQCGACCRRVGKSKDFQEPVNPDGSCSHLKEDNSCGIYETRPMICRVEEFYEKFQSEETMSKEDFFRLNSEECNNMMDEDGLDEKLRIDLKIYDYARE